MTPTFSHAMITYEYTYIWARSSYYRDAKNIREAGE